MRSQKIIFVFISLCLLSGCETMKSWMAPKEESAPVEPKAPRYSENPQMTVPSNRQYRKMTRSRMEDESDLHSQAGSMWVMEGQNSYLFAQNKTRREGDLLNVKLDGPALKQVETKVSVIKKLLKQLEDQQAADAAPAMAANGADATRAPAAVEKKPEGKKEDENELKDVQTVQTRIVEKMPDGNYRVKGAQPFMIGKREYKVLVQGMIRPEDYNDEGVSSQKLLDPQFDVVSIRRNKASEQGLVSKE